MDSLTETLNVAVLGPLGTYTHEVRTTFVYGFA